MIKSAGDKVYKL